jgi:PPOX class probable F420-dependent enzyme
MATAHLTEAQRAFLRNPFAAIATTLRRDGSPHSTVVWVDEDGGDVLFNTGVGRAKERHLRRDPRASLLVVDPANQYRWVAVSGSVTLSTEGGVEHIDKLWRRYNGEPYPSDRPGERVIVRIRPDRVDALGV